MTIAILPVVGMGVTHMVGSDRYPCTVVDVMSPRRCIVQEDIATRIDRNGYDGPQKYTYAPDPSATKIEISLRMDGKWYAKGSPMGYSGSFALGERRMYLDPGF